MGPFKNSHGYEHILVMVLEATPCRKASTEEFITMVKSVIVPHYSTPRILISNGGTDFTGKNFKKCFYKLGIENRVATTYHPQTNGQVEMSNRQLKSILNKTIANRQRLVKEIRWSIVGISDGVQDTNRYDSISICLWQGLSSFD
jgi:transposase InsO family protein